MMDNEVENPPIWLDNLFLETALNSGNVNSKVTVTKSKIKRATAAGDNYASDLYRVTVYIRKRDEVEEKSLIVKAQPKDELLNKAISQCNMYGREIQALTVAIPAMHNLLEAATVQKCQPLSAKCLHAQNNSFATVIVMEDLKEQGFKVLERMCGLDLNHCLLVIRSIARFHATSVVLYEKDPEILKVFMKSVYHEEVRPVIEQFFVKSVRNLAQEIRKWPGYEYFVNKISDVADNYTDNIIQIYTRDYEAMNVLCHGDLWVNNLMFRYSEETGKLEELRLLDFQRSQWTSPANDLQYFLYTSALDLLEKHDILIQEYHRTLGKTFTQLGYGHLHPTLKQLNEQLERKGLYAVMVACSVLCIVLQDRNKVPDIGQLLKQEDQIYFSDQYLTKIKKLLPLFKKRGWI